MTQADAIRDAPDPVATPSDYQAFILGLLGNDDPAEVQAGTGVELRSLLGRAGEDLRTPPADREWSPIEVLGHFVDAEVVTTARYRWILAHDRPDLIAYDQDLWVQRLRHRDDELDELLGLFETLRHANLRLWERTSEGDRERFGMHAERGPESFELLFRLLAGHDRFHLEQMRSTLDQLGR